MRRTINKKGVTSPKGAPGTTNAHEHTSCPCAEQLQIPGIPASIQRDAGPLADWLEAHPGWWGRQFLCAAHGIDERTLRLQSQHGDGRVIFSSSGGGLAATDHADEIEVRSCVAEMEGRIRALATRIQETLRRAGLEARGRA